VSKSREIQVESRWVADRKSARADLRHTGRKLGLAWRLGKSDGQLGGEMEWEEREQHDRSRVLMEEEECSAQMWRRNGGEGRDGRARRWSWRVEWERVVASVRKTSK